METGTTPPGTKPMISPLRAPINYQHDGHSAVILFTRRVVPPLSLKGNTFIMEWLYLFTKPATAVGCQPFIIWICLPHCLQSQTPTGNGMESGYSVFTMCTTKKMQHPFHLLKTPTRKRMKRLGSLFLE